MKTGIVTFIVTGSLALAGPWAEAADIVNIASASGSAAVTVVNPVTVAQTRGLDFGSVTSGAAGAVTLDPVSGARRVNGGVGAVSASAGQTGAFTVTGRANATITVVVDGAITGFGGGITGSTLIGTLPTTLAGTTAIFSIGGALAIPANTPPGAYTGTYGVAVNYP